MSFHSNFNVNDFQAQVLGGFGLARTNRFEVDVISPRGLSTTYDRVVSLLASDSMFPQLTIFHKSHRIFGPPNMRPIYSDYGGEGINIQFYIDGLMDVKRFFEDWVGLVVDHDTFTVSYQKDYVSTIRIKQLNEMNEIVYEIELYEAFPRNVNILELNQSANNQFHRLNVMFAFRYWRRTI